MLLLPFTATAEPVETRPHVHVAKLPVLPDRADSLDYLRNIDELVSHFLFNRPKLNPRSLWCAQTLTFFSLQTNVLLDINKLISRTVFQQCMALPHHDVIADVDYVQTKMNTGASEMLQLMRRSPLVHKTYQLYEQKCSSDELTLECFAR